MAKRGKKYIEIKKKQPKQTFTPVDGVAAVKKLSYSKFPGTIELHLAVKLPKEKEAKSVKGSVSLPHSLGSKAVKVALFTNKEREGEAKDAGADFYEFDKLVAAVKAGKIEFDVAIATPDVMAQMASLGKQLGPKGLMPNPKTGTVTTEIAKTVSEYKKGKLTFGCDETGVMHFPVGKINMDNANVVENMMAVINAAAESLGKKPEQIVKSAHLAPTMGPSVSVQFTFGE